MNQKKINTLSDLYQKLNEMQEAVKGGESFAIVTHNNPDGDGLAACLGLKSFFSSQQIQLDIILQGESLDKLAFLQVEDNTKQLTSDMSYDNLMIIDCHGFDRINEAKLLVEKAKRVLVIDHHIITKVIEKADYYINTQAASVGIIIFNLLKNDLKKLDKLTQNYFAKSIYTTIINDTNNFLNTNVNQEVFQVCQELLEFGIVPAEITTKFLYEKEAREFKMIGQSLATISLHHDNKTLLYHTTRDFLDSNNLADSATSKMTQWVKGVKGIQVVLYYWEKTSDEFKFSIRSENHNVQVIAKSFGGGGHDKAAGFTAKGKIDEILEKVLAEIKTKIYG